ncbi:TPA: ead/Ea22-like family protein [Enterobacter roggenkampii]|nr:ead/Ea22-like family protein [Enterobacter roggenkampii]HDR2524468.1 ead/Ea22-like family protein [Enterobacter roggenkampii]
MWRETKSGDSPMKALNKQALRQLATDAHELGIIKRYTKGIEANKRFVAFATPLTVLALLDELEAAEKRIAELEARTPYGYLRQCDGQIQISIGSERPHDRSGGYATPWFAIYTAAGIGVKGE